MSFGFFYIKKLFIYLEFRKHFKSIRGFMQRVKNEEDQLIVTINDLKSQKRLITPQQIEGIQDYYKNDVLKESIYSLSTSLLQLVEQHHKILSTFNSFMIFDQDYNRKKENIHHLLLLLPDILEEVNSGLKIHYIRAYSFIETVNNLKLEYITYTQTRLLLQPENEASYEFFITNLNKVDDNKVQEFVEYFGNLSSYVKEWNQEFVNREMEANKGLFDNIDGKSLDSQQRAAIVTNEDSNLILAGAGSGKTLTISGKVKYLIDRKNVKPDEILLISFTKKSAEEMDDRIAKKLGVKVDVKTFHKLGLEIISKTRNTKPSIFDSMDKVVDDYFKTQIFQDKKYLQHLMQFFGYYINIPKSLDEFDNLGDYHEHYKSIDFETLKSKSAKQEYVDKHTKDMATIFNTYGGERVKSLEEFIIANFLFLNGINYEYEKDYPHLTANESYRQYKPDFYLPDYDLYIEHFGVNEKYKAPYLSKMEEEKYIEGMQWKRNLHREHGTTLIETYSFYNKQGNLLKKLESSLKKNRVEFKEINFQELFSVLYDQINDRYFVEFKKLIGTFINLFKSKGYTTSEFIRFSEENKKVQNHRFLQIRNQIFFSLVEPIYGYYQDFLAKTKEIDFNDMINAATDIVKQGKLSFPYKYIIIDEYQDISQSRFNLVNAIRSNTKAKIMCVGDDWQSIYRFAGSDVQLFTKFRDYFGQHKLLRIENTYRNSQELIDIAGKFVMKNPNQYTKDLKSYKTNNYPIRILGFSRNQILLPLFKAIEEIVSLYGPETEIMLLGRNNFDIKILDGNTSFKVSSNSKVTYFKYPKLKISFLTVHRSKGLEAENVILLNAKNSTVGFPNKISDDPVLNWVLNDSDVFEFAEERRLFYVAVTRTKNTTYILAPESDQSSFVKELRSDYKIDYESDGEHMFTNPNCPRCQSGHLLVRENGSGGQFLGCSNYPGCDYTLNNIEVIHEQINCSVCGGYMVRRKGRNGKPFYGCSYYPKCSNSFNIERKKEYSYSKQNS
ncbi:UvrD-helicase domain-containing protein [Sutcliffiella sp. NPDC057660]|uniref:UvrD-helicase domain-containing protein n=1 Tax=Sutcliffiella sp. NPDC057660 TaxID=3346199 RepID=UPI0036CBB77F